MRGFERIIKEILMDPHINIRGNVKKILKKYATF